MGRTGRPSDLPHRLGIAVALTAPVGATTLAVQGWPLDRVVVRMAVTPDVGDGDTPRSPAGDVQLSPNGTENTCCQLDGPGSCENDPGPYSVGDTLALNTYWIETLDGTQGDWTVDWTQGVAGSPPPPNVVLLFQDEPISFGDLSGVEGEFTFCASGLLTLPPASDCLTLLTGHGVQTPGGTLLPGLNGASFEVADPTLGTCTLPGGTPIETTRCTCGTLGGQWSP